MRYTVGFLASITLIVAGLLLGVAYAVVDDRDYDPYP